ncbi:lipoate--protein ligase family protein [Zavarzinella formosa]|uniref:lipoate--protein ligase family protein n=1 Tax=Zavarzinella formosa TaxID=360055 RepID=UPI00059259E8|nr:lipoate--protein ligase family protein [Zavarzinella formosa]
MIAFDHTMPDAAGNLALDESLLLHAEQTDTFEGLRFWEYPAHAVVLGAGGSVAIDVKRETCERDGVPILRRSSGGGTVLLGRGCLLFSLIVNHRRAAEIRDVNASYRWILGRVKAALSSFSNVDHSGISDLAIDGVKFSGNAQQRKSRAILHHGTILYDFDLPSVPKYLNPPERMPEYRHGRSHEEFVRNIPGTREEIMMRLSEVFEANPATFPLEALESVPGLVDEKYGRGEWNFRR